jgi:hypothetical protein
MSQSITAGFRRPRVSLKGCRSSMFMAVLR